MTTVAVRDGVMAADTQCYRGDLRGTYRKISRHGGKLIGCAGSVCDVLVLTQWYLTANRASADKPAFSTVNDEEVSAVLLVLRDAAVIELVSCFGHVEVLDTPFWAVGSGAQAAMAAMHMGADAKRAVEIAMLVDAHTGGDVQVEVF